MRISVWKILMATGLSLLAACSSDSSSGGGGSMFVRSCSLGCNSGQGGAQVTCAIVNTFQNQEISVEFSQPVNLNSVNSASFRIIDVLTGQVPNGQFLIDPANPRRIVFRPQISFNAAGDVDIGFDQGASYQITIPGTAQGDSGPFVQSSGGANNASRLLCTITTDQGVADAVPGAPQAAVFVDIVDPATGQVTPNVPAAGAVDVALDSPITFTFNDLMDIGSLVVPSTGQSPSISIFTDFDGDTTDASDQVPVLGGFTFSVDLLQLTTTLVFTATPSLPSGGSGVVKRKIVVNIAASAQDLAGNSISNPGPTAFTPEVLTFAPVTVTEDFDTTSSLQAEESGADMWAIAAPGGLGNMVGKGVGGGPGRLGPLILNAGETLTLYTGPVAATGSLTFLDIPCEGESFELGGQTFVFACTPVLPTDLPIHVEPKLANPERLAVTVQLALEVLQAQVFAPPVILSSRGGNEIVIEAVNPGAAGNAFQIVNPLGSLSSDTSLCTTPNTCTGTISTPPAPSVLASSFTLIGGVDGTGFAPGYLLDNFDFQANPGITPPGILVTDGIFEFSSIDIATGATLELRGPNPARIFSRGRIDTSSGATVLMEGEDRGTHDHLLPVGQPAGRGGPSAGDGGRGGDRYDSTGTPLLGLSNTPGIPNPGANLSGAGGDGVGGIAATAGQGGPAWPTVGALTDQPPGGDWGGNLEPGGGCVSFKVSGPGSGGAYAFDGGDGTPLIPQLVDDGLMTMTPLPLDEDMISNVVDPDGNGVGNDTSGGNNAALMIEPPTAPANVRKLDPDDGNLRGGAGGGGAGVTTYGSFGFDFGFPPSCSNFMASILLFDYPTNSGAGGGGGGGAVQVQSGEQANMATFIAASGGSGGSGIPPSSGSGQVDSTTGQAGPGGGGSGGAILIQGHSVNITTVAGVRLDIDGGLGGSGLQGALGGDGSPGLVRVEDTLGLINMMSIASVVNPLSMTPEDLLSVGQGDFQLGTSLPRALQGAQSCWIQPDTSQGLFAALFFDSDAPGALGWDATLVVDFGGGPQEVSYRDPAQNGGLIPAGMSFQDFWGDLLNDGAGSSAPVVFRFQGAKTLAAVPDLCAVDDSVASIQLQNITPWIRHPDEANAFQPPSDLLRFAIIFDESHPDAGKILGVSSFTFSAQPD